MECDPVEFIILWMRENMQQKLTLEKLDSETKFSPSHVSLLFRYRIDQPPSE
jgi:transcriptional regulator GlxA family with amidase domain